MSPLLDIEPKKPLGRCHTLLHYFSTNLHTSAEPVAALQSVTRKKVLAHTQERTWPWIGTIMSTASCPPMVLMLQIFTYTYSQVTWDFICKASWSDMYLFKRNDQLRLVFYTPEAVVDLNLHQKDQRRKAEHARASQSIQFTLTFYMYMYSNFKSSSKGNKRDKYSHMLCCCWHREEKLH